MIHYFDSPALGLPAKYDDVSGVVTVKDLVGVGLPGYVQYSWEEIELLKKTGITPIIHLVKKTFNGVIVGVNCGK